MDIGQKIKLLRARTNTTQAQLAKKVGITQQSLQAIEIGKTKQPRNIDKIAKALNITQDYLLNHSVDELGDPQLTYPLFSWDAFYSQQKHYQENAKSARLTAFDASLGARAKAFALSIPQHVHSPQFWEDTEVLVDPDEAIKNGDVVLIGFDRSQELSLRLVNKDGDAVFLKSFNPDIPELLDFHSLSSKQISFFGIVAALKKNFK